MKYLKPNFICNYFNSNAVLEYFVVIIVYPNFAQYIQKKATKMKSWFVRNMCNDKVLMILVIEIFFT